MKLRITTQPEPSWDEQLRALAGPLFHSTAWAKYAVAGQANLVPLYCSAGGDAAALFFRQASRNPLFRPLSQRWYCDAHPALSDGDPALFAAFLTALEREARRQGAVRIDIGSFGTPGGREELAQLGYTLRDRVEFRIDLNQPEEQIWQAMEYKRRKHIRNAIRKAEKLGVVIEELPAREGAAHLRRLQQSTSRRIEARGSQVSFRAEDASDSDPAAMLAAGGCARILGARYQDAIVSAGFFTEMNGLVYYTLAGHAPEAFECQAPTLLLWNAILRAQAAGARWFNFGGTPAESSDPSHPDHGLYTYKEQFGGTVEACSSGSKILSPARHSLHERAKKLMSPAPSK
jgi:CelD/BcsL family acetyltransferase involved in cellulose biosynthesis